MAEPSILIVEDEPDLLMLFKTIIQRHIGLAELLTASGGSKALAVLADRVPTLVLLDLAMPEVDGNQVLHYIMGQPRLNETRVIVVSAVPMRLSETEAQRVALLLTKPVLPQELESAIRSVLGNSP